LKINLSQTDFLNKKNQITSIKIVLKMGWDHTLKEFTYKRNNFIIFKIV